MGLLKKKEDRHAVDLSQISRGGGSEVSRLRPVAVEKLPPCVGECPSGNDIRGWLTTIAQREKLGLSLEEALDKAWQIEVQTNPFPAVMGRVCPHPCEAHCNRKEKDGAVAINSVERTLGDWGIERKLSLPRLEAGGPFPERVAVIGSGPAGLSCAYQLARRGYKVTVFESLPKPGGMLRYGIPVYRLSREVLDAEIAKILDLGVELRSGIAVGRDVTLDALRSEYGAVFVGIGAHHGKTLGLPGEEGPGVFAGTDFLNRINSGSQIDVGKKVLVIGGGDTAIDAARVSLRLSADAAGLSKRMGADVTILYRRTRGEMPAISHEIDEALEEGIAIEFLAAPVRVVRDASGRLKALVVQRMTLGEADESGRRRPVPVEGDLREIEADTVITAVSQEPDWETLGAVSVKGSWLSADAWGRTSLPLVFSGGDNLGLGLATISIGQGRRAAECIHAVLRGGEPKESPARPTIGPEKIKLDWYKPAMRAERSIATAAERLARPFEEADRGIGREQAVEEASRCFSCGTCFGCENCWMYCQNTCFVKEHEVRQGSYYRIKLEVCDGCKKCAQECPCGFLEMA
jgi:NADPH-dependent glutamate synthase beta subunit-like oxidoreductase/Pyruvate/2-oxoacid:ferredoxin oxidoreductase delta subunit